MNPPHDKLIHAEAQLQNNDQMQHARVKQSATDVDQQTIGTCDDDPNKNSMICEVEFSDRKVKEYVANVIAENMLSQVDHACYHSHPLSQNSRLITVIVHL